MHLNVEIKASCQNQHKIRKSLNERNALFAGVDHQVDTYFKVPHGRLKLRKGNIENYLIFYKRKNQSGPKESKVRLLEVPPGSLLKEMLSESLGVLVVVEKSREIYFIGNIKFHIDYVYGLGPFVEIEAIDKDGSIGKKKLLGQCREYMGLFGIKTGDLVRASYSDLLLSKRIRPD